MAETFTCHLLWSGAAKGATTSADFSRDLEIAFPGAPAVAASAAPTYKGDPSRLNPELMLLAAVSSCQALSYLYLAARNGFVVTGYRDEAEGRLAFVDGRMRMSKITLRPIITLASGADEEKARAAVEQAHEGCFVANSVTARIVIEASFTVS